MTITIKPSGQACGAAVYGLDLTKALDDSTVAAVRAAWIKYQVLSFPEQLLNDDDLERFTLYFGPFSEDPFVQSIPGREHIIAVQRNATETSSLFAEAWHTDWSFQAHPPAGTCLFGIKIPPVGGNTLFVNQQLALKNMPANLRSKIATKRAIHSAAGGYAPEGLYGDIDKASNRSMKVVSSVAARKTQLHPLIHRHPESDIESVFGCMGYIVGIEGMSNEESLSLLVELYEWQTQAQFQYSHQWQPNMLVMWDNRSVLHRATGGYDGYDRLLHRTTIGSVSSR